MPESVDQTDTGGITFLRRNLNMEELFGFIKPVLGPGPKIGAPVIYISIIFV